MELTQYVENLRRELTTAAEVGGEDARALAGRLLRPLDAAVRLTLLEALSAAAEEISAELAPGSVDIRLRGGTAGFVVTPPPAAAADDAEAGPGEVRLPVAEGDDGTMVRINLRLPANLKALIEDASAAGGLSVNAWIVRAAAAGLANEGRRATRSAAGRKADRPDRLVGDSYSGWGR
jgi:hypothetical protein